MGNQNMRLKWGGEGKRRIKEGIWGGTSNSKSHLKIHIENYHYKSFLKCIHSQKETKRSHQRMGYNTPTRYLMLLSKTSSARNRLMTCGVIGQRISNGNLQIHRLLPLSRILFILYNLMVRL